MFRTLRRALLLTTALVVLSSALPAASTPTGFVTTVLNPFSLRMTWSLNTNGVTNVVVGYRPGTNGTFVIFPGGGPLAPTTTNLLPTYLLPSAVYQFFVQAQSVGGINMNSTTNTVTMPPFDPPTNFVTTATSPTAVKLTWTDRTTNEAGFYVAARSGTNGGFVAVTGSLPPNTTNYTVTGLLPGGLYQFFIQSYYADSYVTNAVNSATNTITLPGLNAPTNLHATAVSGTSVSLNWSDVSSNEANFIVLIRAGTNGSFGVPAGGILAPNTTNFTITGLSSVSTYQFLVETYFDADSAADSALLTVDTANVFTSRAFHPAVVGQPISPYTLAATTARGAPDSFAAAALPPGLVFDGTSQIYGVPSQAGVFTAQLIAHYPSEGYITNPLTFRVIHPAAAPAVTAAIPKQTLTTNGPPATVSLNSFFADLDTEKAVHFVTTKGNFDLALYTTATPQTVSNFLGYVTRLDYTNSIIYRASHLGFFQDFVVQGGGMRTNGSDFFRFPTPASPSNEPGVQHVRGTISMAKQDGVVNSATSDWFVNMRDNSDQLDDQNGGFAAFGRVCGSGMNVFDAIMQLPRSSYTVTLNGSPHGFNDWPLDTPPPAPATMDQTKLVIVQSVTPVEPLSYSVTGNTLTNVATAEVVGTNLFITPVALLGGTTVITVSATDLDGNVTTQDLTVEISSPYTTWLNSFSLTGSNSLPTANPDGDRFNNAVEFALMGSPGIADNSSIKGTNSFVSLSSQQYLALTFKVRKSLGGAAVLVRSAATVNGSFATIWTSNDAGNPLEVARVDRGDHWLITVRDSVAVSAGTPGRFLNLEVQTP